MLSVDPQPIKVDNSILIQFHFFFLHTFVPDWQAKIEGAFDSTYTQSKHMVEIKLILNNYEFGVMIMTRHFGEFLQIRVIGIVLVLTRITGNCGRLKNELVSN